MTSISDILIKIGKCVQASQSMLESCSNLFNKGLTVYVGGYMESVADETNAPFALVLVENSECDVSKKELLSFSVKIVIATCPLKDVPSTVDADELLASIIARCVESENDTILLRDALLSEITGVDASSLGYSCAEAQSDVLRLSSLLSSEVKDISADDLSRSCASALTLSNELDDILLNEIKGVSADSVYSGCIGLETIAKDLKGLLVDFLDGVSFDKMSNLCHEAETLLSKICDESKRCITGVDPTSLVTMSERSVAVVSNLSDATVRELSKKTTDAGTVDCCEQMEIKVTQLSGLVEGADKTFVDGILDNIEEQMGILDDLIDEAEEAKEDEQWSLMNQKYTSAKAAVQEIGGLADDIVEHFEETELPEMARAKVTEIETTNTLLGQLTVDFEKKITNATGYVSDLGTLSSAKQNLETYLPQIRSQSAAAIACRDEESFEDFISQLQTLNSMFGNVVYQCRLVVNHYSNASRPDVYDSIATVRTFTDQASSKKNSFAAEISKAERFTAHTATLDSYLKDVAAKNDTISVNVADAENARNEGDYQTMISKFTAANSADSGVYSIIDNAMRYVGTTNRKDMTDEILKINEELAHVRIEINQYHSIVYSDIQYASVYMTDEQVVTSKLSPIASNIALLKTAKEAAEDAKEDENWTTMFTQYTNAKTDANLVYTDANYIYTQVKQHGHERDVADKLFEFAYALMSVNSEIGKFDNSITTGNAYLSDIPIVESRIDSIETSKDLFDDDVESAEEAKEDEDWTTMFSEFTSAKTNATTLGGHVQVILARFSGRTLSERVRAKVADLSACKTAIDTGATALGDQITYATDYITDKTFVDAYLDDIEEKKDDFDDAKESADSAKASKNWTTMLTHYTTAKTSAVQLNSYVQTISSHFGSRSVSLPVNNLLVKIRAGIQDVTEKAAALGNAISYATAYVTDKSIVEARLEDVEDANEDIENHKESVATAKSASNYPTMIEKYIACHEDAAFCSTSVGTILTNFSGRTLTEAVSACVSKLTADNTDLSALVTDYNTEVQAMKAEFESFIENPYIVETLSSAGTDSNGLVIFGGNRIMDDLRAKVIELVYEQNLGMIVSDTKINCSSASHYPLEWNELTVSFERPSILNVE